MLTMASPLFLALEASSQAKKVLKAYTAQRADPRQIYRSCPLRWDLV
jgi:hypothetical protein